MLEDGTGKTGIDRPLSLVSLRDILIGSNLNTQPEFKKYFSSTSPGQLKKSVTKIILVNAMQTTQKAKDVLDIVAYGMLTNGQSAKDSWKQMRTGVNHKDIYEDRILKGTSRKRNKNTQNKAHVNLSEISKILQKYS